MMADRKKLYRTIYKAFKLVFPTKQAQQLQQDVNAYWFSVKRSSDLETVVKQKLIELRSVWEEKTAMD